MINRGVSTWPNPARTSGQPCRRRVYEATLDARLIALDAVTGGPCADFGKAGQIRLSDVPGYAHTGFGEFMRGWYHMTSPPAIVDDLVIVDSTIDDSNRADMPSGVVRAFDARTGVLRWNWDPMPPVSTQSTGTSAPDANRTVTGAANAWSIMAVDPQRDLVFGPHRQRQSTYAVRGKQYLVIAAGGHQGIREESYGDSLVAFALP